MKALFMWLDGPSANRTVKRSGARVPLGPDGEDSLPVPGWAGPHMWGVLEYENKHYYVIDLGAPEGIFLNDARVKPSDRVEVRAGALLRFGKDGPKLKFGFEIEPQDLLAQAGGDQYSPSEAMRRMEGHMAHSAVRSEEVRAVKESVKDVEKRGTRRWGFAILTGVVGTLIGVAVTYILVRRAEKRTQEAEKKIEQLSSSLINVESNLRKADLEFRRAVAAMPTTEEAAKERIGEIDKRLADLRKDPERHKDEIARLESEQRAVKGVLAGLKNTERRLQEVYEKSLPGLIFLWVEFDIEWRGQRYSMAGCGSGFVIDDRGTAVTAKHVIHPWKFGQTHLSLYQSGVSGWKPSGQARIRAWQAGDAFVLEQSGGQPVVRSTPRWSTENGTLVVRKVEDHLTSVNLLEAFGGRLMASVEDGFEHDVAILELKGKTVPPLRLAEDEDVKVEKLRPLTPILVAGFPLGNQVFEEQKIIAQPTVGYVRKVERLIYHSVPSCPGNSGGPVLNEEGRVIGLVNGAYTEGQNMNISCSAARVRKLLRE
jgi:S1-C subfamily serine protease